MKDSIKTVVTSTYGKERYVHIRTKDGHEINGVVYDWDENVVALRNDENLYNDNYERKTIQWGDIKEAYVPFPKDNITVFAEFSIWEKVSAYVTLANGERHHVQVFDYGDSFVFMFDIDKDTGIEVGWHEIVDISRT